MTSLHVFSHYLPPSCDGRKLYNLLQISVSQQYFWCLSLPWNLFLAQLPLIWSLISLPLHLYLYVARPISLVVSSHKSLLISNHYRGSYFGITQTNHRLKVWWLTATRITAFYYSHKRCVCVRERETARQSSSQSTYWGSLASTEASCNKWNPILHL